MFDCLRGLLHIMWSSIHSFSLSPHLKCDVTNFVRNKKIDPFINHVRSCHKLVERANLYVFVILNKKGIDPLRSITVKLAVEHPLCASCKGFCKYFQPWLIGNILFIYILLLPFATISNLLTFNVFPICCIFCLCNRGQKDPRFLEKLHPIHVHSSWLTKRI